MLFRKSKITTIQIVALVSLGLGVSVRGQSSSNQKEGFVVSHSKGTFEVKITPQEDAALDKTFSRMSIDKQIHGDLEATSKGLMLATGGPKEGAGGYVALERVTGTLGGRTGSFTLQHNA